MQPSPSKGHPFYKVILVFRLLAGRLDLSLNSDPACFAFRSLSTFPFLGFARRHGAGKTGYLLSIGTPNHQRPMIPLVLTSLLAATRITSFPGSWPSRSPDNRYVVSCSAKKSLVLDGACGNHTLIPHIERSANILWSPGSEFLAITDNDGSAESITFLVSMGAPDKKIEVNPPERIREELQRIKADHVYVTGVRWLSRDRLLVGVYAYGITPGPKIKKTFVFHLQ